MVQWRSGNATVCKTAMRGFDSLLHLMEPKLFIAFKALIVHNGKVLILRESEKYEDGTNANRYDVVGGRLEPGEQFEESLRREIEEETGLQVTIKSPFFVNEARPVVKGEPWQIIRVFMECQADSDKVVLSQDHDVFEWIDPQEHTKYPLIENLRPVFNSFIKK